MRVAAAAFLIAFGCGGGGGGGADDDAGTVRDSGGRVPGGATIDGDLQLDTVAVGDAHLWVVNRNEGTISKIDTRTGAELARYATVTHDTPRVVNHVSRAYPAWDAGGGGTGTGVADNHPLRTAIDSAGDVWVSNRAADVASTQPSVTKIQNATASCADTNGDRMISTSHEVNGTPGIQLDDEDEFFGEADECIVMTVVIGALGDQASALAVDADDDVWVGLVVDQSFVEIDGATGAILQPVDTTGVRPSSAVIDGAGRLWASDDCCGTVDVGVIDTTDNPAPFTLIETKPDFTDLGQGNDQPAIDLEGRVWIAGNPYGGAMRYTPGTSTWDEAIITGYAASGVARAVAADAYGAMWVSFGAVDAPARVARIDADTLVSTGTFLLAEGGDEAELAVAVGIDVDGHVWTVNQGTDNVSRLAIDPETRNPAPHPTTGNIVDVFPAGRAPHAGSDFVAHSRMVHVASDEVAVPVEACDGEGEAAWGELRFDATTPAGTEVSISVRAADDEASLEDAPTEGPWDESPVALDQVPHARYLLVVIEMTTEDPQVTPVVHEVEVTWTCPHG